MRAVRLRDADGAQATVNLDVWRDERRLRALLGPFAAAPQVQVSATVAGMLGIHRDG